MRRLLLYDDTGAGLIGEYNSAGELIRGYQYPPNSLYTSDPVVLKTLAASQPEDQPTQYDYSFYQNDHLGTPQRLMQISGATVWQADYDVFGEVKETKSQISNPLRMPGRIGRRGFIRTTLGIIIRLLGGIFRVIRLGWKVELTYLRQSRRLIV